VIYAYTSRPFTAKVPAAVLDRVIDAEQSDFDLWRLGMIAAAREHMPTGQVAEHFGGKVQVAGRRLLRLAPLEDILIPQTHNLTPIRQRSERKH